MDKPTLPPAPGAAARFRHLALATAVAAYLLVVASPDSPALRTPWHALGALLAVLLLAGATAGGRRLWRADPAARRSAWLVAGLLAAQVGLGALAVAFPALAPGALLGTATAFLAVVLVLGLPARVPLDFATPADRFRYWTLAAAGGVWVLTVQGGWVAARAAGTACPDWPLCFGTILPPGGGLVWLQWSHRLVAFAVGMLVLWVGVLAYRTQRHRPAVLAAAALALGLYLVQSLLGAAAVLTLRPPAATLHLALAVALFTALVVLAVLASRVRLVRPVLGGEAVALPLPRRRPLQVVGDYIALMKPRIIVLLLVTTYAAMLSAARGMRLDPLLILHVMLGGTLMSGGAGAINCYLDRDLDARMRRTSGRPVPAGHVEPERALVFGMVISAVALVQLWVAVNPLSALLSLAGNLLYVFVYTGWLKRRTHQNIVWGGVAGAVPPLVGWAAVTGTVALPAWVMFAIVFFWTPPHFWALGLFRTEDYRRAGVPMLPVVKGHAATKKQIFWYSAAMVPLSLWLYALGAAGTLYLWGAVVLGAGMILTCLALLWDWTPRAAHLVFGYSLAYLALLFLLMALNPGVA